MAEKTRINISMFLFTFYSLIIITYGDKLWPAEIIKSQTLVQFLIYMFPALGTLIAFCLFIFLIFVGLEYNYEDEKQITAEQFVSLDKIQAIKKWSYNTGIRIAIASIFVLPFTFPATKLWEATGGFYGIILGTLFIALGIIVLGWIFNDHKKHKFFELNLKNVLKMLAIALVTAIFIYYTISKQITLF